MTVILSVTVNASVFLLGARRDIKNLIHNMPQNSGFQLIFLYCITPRPNCQFRKGIKTEKPLQKNLILSESPFNYTSPESIDGK